LSLLAPLVQIGGTMPRIVTVPGDPNPKLAIGGTFVDIESLLLLSPDFFGQGGFRNFSVKCLGLPAGEINTYIPGVEIKPGTVISPKIQNLVVQPSGNTGGLELMPT